MKANTFLSIPSIPISQSSVGSEFRPIDESVGRLVPQAEPSDTFSRCLCTVPLSTQETPVRVNSKNRQCPHLFGSSFEPCCLSFWVSTFSLDKGARRRQSRQNRSFLRPKALSKYISDVAILEGIAVLASSRPQMSYWICFLF